MVEPLLKAEQVAELLGISTKSVQELTWGRDRRIPRLPVVKIGARNRYRPSDIERWVDERVRVALDGDRGVAS